VAVWEDYLKRAERDHGNRKSVLSTRTAGISEAGQQRVFLSRGGVNKEE
jgi:hypothetical protein